MPRGSLTSTCAAAHGRSKHHFMFFHYVFCSWALGHICTGDTLPLGFLFFTNASAIPVPGGRRPDRVNKTYERWTGDVFSPGTLPWKLTLGTGDKASTEQAHFALCSRPKASPPTWSRRTWVLAQQRVVLVGVVPGCQEQRTSFSVQNQHSMTVSMVSWPHGAKELRNTLHLPSSLVESPAAWAGKAFDKCAERAWW